MDSTINGIHLEDAYAKPVPAKSIMQLQVFKDDPIFDKCNFTSTTNSLPES